jgi:hypothetical protein
MVLSGIAVLTTATGNCCTFCVCRRAATSNGSRPKRGRIIQGDLDLYPLCGATLAVRFALPSRTRDISKELDKVYEAN